MQFSVTRLTHHTHPPLGMPFSASPRGSYSSREDRHSPDDTNLDSGTGKIFPDLPQRGHPPLALPVAGHLPSPSLHSPTGRRLSRLGPGLAGSLGGALQAHGDSSPSRACSPEDVAASSRSESPWQPWTEEEAERALAEVAGRSGPPSMAQTFLQVQQQQQLDGGGQGEASVSGGLPLPPMPLQGSSGRMPLHGMAARGMGGPLGEGYDGGGDSGLGSVSPTERTNHHQGLLLMSGGGDDTLLASMVQRAQSQGGRKVSQYRRGGVTVSESSGRSPPRLITMSSTLHCFPRTSVWLAVYSL